MSARLPAAAAAFGLRTWRPGAGLYSLLMLLIGSWAAPRVHAQIPPSLLPQLPGTTLSPRDTLQRWVPERRVSLDMLFQLILAYHPVARQADLLPQEAQYEIRQARGLFDPKLTFDWAGKTLKGIDYYSDIQSELKVPTWIGLDLKAGYERNVGAFPNPEQQTDREGLAYIGLSLPIGRDWIIDQRRATLRQAQLFGSIAQAERIKELNKLLLSAAKDYWFWYEATRAQGLFQLGLGLAEFRLAGTRARILAGDLAALDSVEAVLEVQRRQGQLLEAELALRNARLRIATYLWDAQGRPAELQAGAVPDTLGTEREDLTDEMLLEALALATDAHPELLKIEAKLQQLELERKLAINNLLPRLSVDFKPLLLPTNPGNGWTTLRGNYKYGINFDLPLFLRKETGKLGQVRTKLRSAEYDLQDTRRMLLNQIESTRNDIRTLDQLLSLQSLTVRNAQTLLQGEQGKFENGESSLFLVNQRERALLDAQLKYVALQAKYAGTKVAFRWAIGRPFASSSLGAR